METRCSTHRRRTKLRIVSSSGKSASFTPKAAGVRVPHDPPSSRARKETPHGVGLRVISSPQVRFPAASTKCEVAALPARAPAALASLRQQSRRCGEPASPVRCGAVGKWLKPSGSLPENSRVRIPPALPSFESALIATRNFARGSAVVANGTTRNRCNAVSGALESSSVRRRRTRLRLQSQAPAANAGNGAEVGSEWSNRRTEDLRCAGVGVLAYST